MHCPRPLDPSVSSCILRRINLECAADIVRANEEEAHLETKTLVGFVAKRRIYQDADILVIDKPAGLLSVDGRTLKVSLLGRLIRLYPDISLVHRLDMDTSGVMVFGMHKEAAAILSKAFAMRRVQKHYVADVCGQMRTIAGAINAPLRRADTLNTLSRSPLPALARAPRHQVDFQHKKRALTFYRRIASTKDITRVLVAPITGRSHQIRVHLTHLGHPILGDVFYGADNAPTSARLHLHATHLQFAHPTTGVDVVFGANVPF